MRMRFAKNLKHARGDSLGRELLEAVRLNWEMVLLAVLLVGGMAGGALYARNADVGTLNRLDFLFAGDFQARLSEPFLSIFSASFASSFLFIFACFLCGLSMWGAFMIPLVLLFRGFGLGLTSGYLYAAYLGKGILFNLAVILPGAFICCLSILLASREGIRFSRKLAASCDTTAFERAQIKRYSLRFGAILGIAFLAAIIDLLLSACFGSLFTF